MSASLLSVYSTPGDMVDASKFICGIYIGILSPLMHIEQFEYMEYVTFQRHICGWHISSSSMVNKCPCIYF